MYLLGRLSPFTNSGCLLPCSLGPHHSALQWFGFGETSNHHLESNPINKVGDKAIESDLGCPHPRRFEGRGNQLLAGRSEPALGGADHPSQSLPSDSCAKVCLFTSVQQMSCKHQRVSGKLLLSGPDSAREAWILGGAPGSRQCLALWTLPACRGGWCTRDGAGRLVLALPGPLAQSLSFLLSRITAVTPAHPTS